jgi:GAF domain-containing protein
VLDTLPEQALDDLTALAAKICGAPIAAISHRDLFMVPDATQDGFAQNPLVTCQSSIRFYAGLPLITPEGAALGELCVIDPCAAHADAGAGASVGSDPKTLAGEDEQGKVKLKAF